MRTAIPLEELRDRNGDRYDARSIAAMRRWDDDLLGHYLAFYARGSREEYNRLGYQPMVNYRRVAQAMANVWRMAGDGPMFTQLAATIRVNPYGTDGSCYGQISQAFHDFLNVGTWDDVAARTGPEPVRHSTAQRKFTPADLILLDYYWHAIVHPFQTCVRGVGWVTSVLAQRYHVGVPRWVEDELVPPARKS